MRESMTALIAKNSLRDWLLTEDGLNYFMATVEVLIRRYPEDFEKVSGVTPAQFNTLDDDQREQLCFDIAKNSTTGWAHRLNAANAYWTSPDMTRIVDEAAREMPEDFLMRADMLIDDHGLAYLSTPLWVAGTRVDAIAWHTFSGKINLYPLAARHGHDDPVGEQIARTNTTNKLGLLVPMVPTAISFNTPIPDAAVNKFMAAWFFVIQQPLALRDTQHPRHKELKRDRRIKPNDHITEIRLRSPKVKRTYGESGEIEWTHRWIVKTHYAWRACGAEHQFAEPDGKGGWHARVYIHAYVKGPDDKPLIIREHVYRWDR